jgi:biotin transport system substrate-specific component
MTAFPLIPSSTLSATLIGTRVHSSLVSLLLVVGGSLLIAASAQVAIRLPISPVPITGQTFAVLIVGMALGSRLGTLAVITYLAEGIFLPVFTEFRTWAHPLTLWTAGYLFGFIGAAYLTGWLAERGWDRHPITTATAMLLGNIAIYIPGMLWLGYMYATTADLTGMMALVSVVMVKGFALFLIGDGLKLLLAMAVFPMAWKWVQRNS